MKTTRNRAWEQGGVLIVTLFIASLFGMFLYSHLNIVRGQRALVARSQAWNSALALAESGAEEALAHLNPGVPYPTVNRAGNGWGQNSGLYGPVVRNLTEGSYGVVFTADQFPIIYATGYVSVPSIPAGLKRVVEVKTRNSPIFTAAMAARYNIDLLGNNVSTDSFDSADPLLSNDGRYDPTRASTNGDVASILGIVNVGNGNVDGSVLLGPTATDTISRNGQITGGIYRDFNVEFEDVIVPPRFWMTAVMNPQTIDGVTYDYVFDSSTTAISPQQVSGDYSLDNLRGSVFVGTNTTINLALTGDARARVVRVGGRDTEAGNLTVFMDGPSFSISGATAVDGGSATNLTYYGTTNNTQISFSGNASFTGTIYAPQADFSLGGGGSTVYDFVGASVTRSVRMNGHFNFHFDENLIRAGPMLPYVAASWREL